MIETCLLHIAIAKKNSDPFRMALLDTEKCIIFLLHIMKYRALDLYLNITMLNLIILIYN